MAKKWKNDFKTFKDGITYSIEFTDFEKYYSSLNAFDYLEGIDGSAYPQKVKFEFGDDHIISTHLNSNDNEVFRYVFKGNFSYKKNLLKTASFSEGVVVFHELNYGDDQYGYRVESKSDIKILDTSSFNDFNEATDKLFRYENVKDDYELYGGDYDVLKGEGKSNILSGEFSSFFSPGWYVNPFEGDLIADQSDKFIDRLPKKVNTIDIITGTPGKDKLKGKKSSVHLKGMGGKDKLTGSSKDDILDGGDGNDVLNGKKGADVYVLSSGKDKFKGFKLKEGDTIQIDSDITYSLVQSKKNTLINHDDGVTTVYKVNKNDLTSVIEIVT